MKKLSIFIVAMCVFIAVSFWFLPPHLKSPITHSETFRSIVSWFDPDSRVVINDNTYPWRSIGLVHGRSMYGPLCTGFLIGRDTVATSRHCVMEDDGRQIPNLRYSVVRHTHYGMVPYDALQVLARPVPKDAVKLPGMVEAASDFAVLRISGDVGDSVGYFGSTWGRSLHAGQPGSMPDDPVGRVGAYCGDTIGELPAPDPAALPQHLRDIGITWIAPDVDRPPRICAAGFSGDLGYARLSVAHACGLLAMLDGLVIHNCTVSNGASGGPIFHLDSSGVPIAFATNTGVLDAGPLKDIFDLEEVSIGTLFADPAELPTASGTAAR